MFLVPVVGVARMKFCRPDWSILSGAAKILLQCLHGRLVAGVASVRFSMKCSYRCLWTVHKSSDREQAGGIFAMGILEFRT